MLRILALLLFATAVSGCPKKDPKQDTDVQPSAPIPAEHALLRYEDLRLGMSNFDISQSYNAPDGQGKGFTRAVEEYGDARNHIIEFDKVADRPGRRIVLRVYQDKLGMIVDRRDGLTEEQATEWFASLKEGYGDPVQETLGGAQWVWGGKGGIMLTYTQDNSSPTDMSANMVLVHEPTYEASKRYLQLRETGR